MDDVLWLERSIVKLEDPEARSHTANQTLGKEQRWNKDGMVGGIKIKALLRPMYNASRVKEGN